MSCSDNGVRYMIRLVTMDSFGAVMLVFRSAIGRMEEMNIQQWDEVYPDETVIRDDIEKGSLYGYFQGDELCAVQVLNPIQAPEYAQIEWKYPDNNPLVLHRLCVAPRHQNKGISREMIRFAEKYAVENLYKTIRFDAFVDNLISVGIYRKMGYIDSGIVRFRKGDFYCFEKKTVHYP